MTECTICLEKFEKDGKKVPRLLPCSHTFCTDCIDKLPADDLTCPKCRAKFEMPANGAEGLKINFALRDSLTDNAAAPATKVAAPAINATKNEKKEEKQSDKTENEKTTNSANNNSCSTTAHKAKDKYAVGVSINAAKATALLEGTKVAEQLHNVLIELEARKGVARAPLDICCVVDTSGSMSTEAKIKDENGKTETHGLTLLDVVKHAVNTISKLLQEDDRLSIVEFSNQASEALKLRKMDKNGQQAAEKALKTLTENGGTNLWAGLTRGLDVLKKNCLKGRASVCLLLTDGQPTNNPARGHVAALETYFKKNPKFTCTLSTFGFGYAVKSKLLRDMALRGGGNYIFIPDASFVGTAFVNATANALSTFAQSVRLTLTPKNGASIFDAVSLKENESFELFGNHAVKISDKPTGAVELILGDLQFDKDKHIVVPMLINKEGEAYLDVEVSYTNSAANGSRSTIRETGSETSLSASAVNPHVWRCMFAKLITDLVINSGGRGTEKWLKKAQKQLEEFADAVMDENENNKNIASLLEDLNGQVTEAFSKLEWFRRWGQHYALSLSRSHILQQCSNFKDAGLQNYAGPLFLKLQEEGDEIFCKIPAPQPAPPPKAVIEAQRRANGGNYVAPAPRRINMARYHNVSMGCVHANSMVLLANGEQVRAEQVRAGQSVAVPRTNNLSSRSSDIVECIVKTPVPNNKTLFAKMPNSALQLTPYHPVYFNNTWVFPIDVAECLQESQCDFVYSFLLKNRSPSMQIDGIPTIALAHGLTDNKVVSHQFFGTEKCVESLEKCSTFASGSVTVRDAERNDQNLICNYIE